MTQDEADLAMFWGSCQLGLQGWDVSVALYADAPQSMDVDDAGRAFFSRVNRKLKVAICLSRCVEFKFNPLEVLFHELVHAALEDSNMPTEGDTVEFFIDRYAESLAFAYRHGMKSWRGA